MDGNMSLGGDKLPMGQPSGGAIDQSPLSKSGDAIDPDDWRSRLSLDSRHKNVDKIMETFKKHLPFSREEELLGLKNIAVGFEEKIYSTATDQSDYLRKIFYKMPTMETKSQAPTANSLQTNASNVTRNSSNPVSNSMQSQIPNQALAMPIFGGQSQGRQQFFNNMSAAGVQNSASLTFKHPVVGNLTQGSMVHSIGQNSNLLNMQNNSIGLGAASNSFANSQSQILGRQHQVLQQMQLQQMQQRQSQTQAKITFLQQQQQLQHVLPQLQQLLLQQQLQLLQLQQQQQPSPQIDQQNLVSLTKTGKPLHTYIIPPPSTPLATSPKHGEWKKVNSSISSVPNTTGIGYLQAPKAAGSTQSLAIDIPGKSASSPLLAEFTSLDGKHGNSSTVISRRSIERLIKAVSVVVFIFSFFFYLHAWC